MFGSNKTKDTWARSFTRVVSMAEQHEARVLGITSSRTGAGVSTIASNLAQALAHADRQTLLLKTAHLEFPEAPGAIETGEADISAMITPSSSDHRLQICDLAGTKDDTPRTTEHWRAAFDKILKSVSSVVVDLPPICEAPGRSTHAYRTIAPACDIVLLVCLTNDDQSEEITDCIEQSRIHKVNLVGQILNDRKLPGSYLLAQAALQ